MAFQPRTYRRAKPPMSEEQALAKLAQMCSVAEHCRQEMVEKSTAWGLEPEAAERVADRLVAERFVDDSRYAPIFVRDKARFGGWGPTKVRMALLSKGVDENLTDDAIAAFSHDEWQQILQKAIASKIRSATQSDPQKLLASVIRFGLGRGYSYSDIRQAIDALGGIEGQANDDE